MNKSDTIKELRRRARDGEIGVEKFFYACEPCCALGHALELRFGEEHGLQLSNLSGLDFDDRGDGSNGYDVIEAALDLTRADDVMFVNDGEESECVPPDPSAAVEIIAKEWGIPAYAEEESKPCR